MTPGDGPYVAVEITFLGNRGARRGRGSTVRGTTSHHPAGRSGSHPGRIDWRWTAYIAAPIGART